MYNPPKKFKKYIFLWFLTKVQQLFTFVSQDQRETQFFRINNCFMFFGCLLWFSWVPVANWVVSGTQFFRRSQFLAEATRLSPFSCGSSHYIHSLLKKRKRKGTTSFVSEWMIFFLKCFAKIASEQNNLWLLF